MSLDDDLNQPSSLHFVQPSKEDSARAIRIAKSPFSEIHLDWEEVDPNTPEDNESRLITGNLALRMLNFLELYNSGGWDFARYISDPDCHGAAMYVTGVVDYIKRVSPKSEFRGIYSRRKAEFSYTKKPAPTLVHLLTEELPLLEDNSQFRERNTPHSVVHLGVLNGTEICFEKKGKNPAGFVTLESTERYYWTSHRVYVTPLNPY